MANRSSLFTNVQKGAGYVKGLAELQAKIASYPARVKAPLVAALNQSADEIVERAKSIAPAAPASHPEGALRDSIHKAAGRHELSVDVIVDAKDEKGRIFAAHVEFGHKAEDGHHVAPTPFLFPTVRVTKKRIKSRLGRAMTKAIKEAHSGS
jgi:HK97 gp10 family phage protein